MKINKKALTVSIIIPLAVGALAGFLTKDSMQQFAQLAQPPLAPPGWLFPIVWTILFVLMGIASYLVYQQGTENPDVMIALRLYAIQLVFNFFWSIIFFNFGWYFFAFIWLLTLWLLIILTIRQFAKVDKRAAYLMIPYLIWVTFAAYLNLGIYWLN